MAYAKQGQEGKTRLERLQDTARDFGHFLYNTDNEEGKITIMGRDKASWAKITVFFLIFYGCLAGFFAAMLNIFLTTIPEREMGPKRTGFLENKPGLIPTPVSVEGFSQSYIDSQVKKINSFLAPYRRMIDNEEYVNCSSDTERVKGSRPCSFDLTSLGECYNGTDEGFQYGYDEGKPCIFFKMNKIYGWTPESKGGEDYVELTCKFQDGDSKENLIILPAEKPGFLTYFYPFYSEENWYSPIAALKVNTTARGVVLCDVLGKNIELSESYRFNRGAMGRARIEIKQ
ncbi:sodium/potassium-transporting ATPase subunit beta-3-like [Montipora foliosa]|uniref:sodium/potassium-transporting ATPase subunit beta-3-like n=1 Tax=Montipora foliosa TaxID=591990 RepID=UPI0035F206E2